MGVRDWRARWSGLFRRPARSEGQEERRGMSVSVDGGTRWFEELAGGVGASTAMKVSTVYRCLEVLSEGVAQLTLELQRRRDGVWVKDEGRYLSYLLEWRPNARQSSFDLLKNLIVQELMYGNAYVYPRLGVDDYEELVLLSPYSVVYNEFTNRYQISDAVNKIYKIVDADEILHFRHLSLDGGYQGRSVIESASEVLGIARAGDKDARNVMSKHGDMRATVSTVRSGGNQGLNRHTTDQLKDASVDVNRSYQRGDQFIAVPDGTELKTFGIPPRDYELLENRKFTVFEICRFFGVHPDKVFAEQTTNYKASEMSQINFMTDTLRPRLNQIETEMNVKLLARRELRDTRIKFNIDDLYLTDLSTMAEYTTKMAGVGAYTVNEIRARMGKLPVAGGDVVMVSTNTAPLGERSGTTGKTQDGPAR